MNIKPSRRHYASMMPDFWPTLEDGREIVYPELRSTELEVHYYQAPEWTIPKPRKAIFPSRTFTKKKKENCDHNLTIIIANCGFGVSKFPQPVCRCNASPLPHRHEDNGIWDCYTGSLRPYARVL